MRPPLPAAAPTAHLDDPVLIEHDGVLVCDKPAGLPTSGRDLQDPWSLQALLMVRRRRRKIWAPHQLDADTSGLNLFVQRKALVSEVGDWMRGGRKRYLAVVAGEMGEPRTIRAPIGWRRDGRKRFPTVAPDGRPATSHVEPLDVRGGRTLVAVRIETGRTHQVRLHLAHLGHGILGDRLHGGAAGAAHPRQALHAWTLDLPAAPAPLQRLCAPIPRDLRTLLDTLGLVVPDAG